MKTARSRSLPLCNPASDLAIQGKPAYGSPSTRNPTFADRPVDIIWNTTLVCPWNCDVCCVDAVHVTRRADQVAIAEAGLRKIQLITYDREQGTIYDHAAWDRQRRGLELDLSGKLQVLDNLAGFTPKLDISGGDPLSVGENFEVLEKATARFGRTQITLTATGAGLVLYDVGKLAPLIGELNFTYDNLSTGTTTLRPTAYAKGNLKKASEFAVAGVKTRGECPLSCDNIDPAILGQIYRDLHKAGIDKLLVMRLFPVGRGYNQKAAAPSPQQYRDAIAFLRDLEAEYGHPEVKLQCALKHLENFSALTNPCDLVRESFGLMADGTLLASPWAVGPSGEPLDEVFVLGNLATTPLGDILASKKVARFAERLDENHGHCKIFAFVNSKRPSKIDRLFDHADPLFTNDHERVKL